MLLIANMGNPGEIGRRSLAARPFTRSGLRGVGRELLLDRRTVALEPVLHLHELAAFDRPDLHPAATLVVGPRELQPRYKAAQREAFDRLHALLDILRRRSGAALGLDGVAYRLDVQGRDEDTAIVVDG